MTVLLTEIRNVRRDIGLGPIIGGTPMPQRGPIIGRTAMPRCRPMARAFTLMELLVVIAIMAVLMAVAMPAIKSLGSNNNQKQAVNLLTTLLANARASAIQSHTWAGLVIYEDPGTKNQSAAQVVIASAKDPTKPTLTYFVRAGQAGPDSVPPGIKVATLDDASTLPSFRTEVSTGSTACRIILFDENGQMVMRNGLAEDPSLVAANDLSAKAWNLNATAGSEPNGVSTPGLLVYDAGAMKADSDNGNVNLTSPSSVAGWLKGHADLIIVNSYTGNVIR